MILFLSKFWIKFNQSFKLKQTNYPQDRRSFMNQKGGNSKVGQAQYVVKKAGGQDGAGAGSKGAKASAPASQEE